MSHFTKIKTKIYDLEILKKSLTDLNLEFTAENLEINGYNNQKASADLIIRQSNNYDIGFKWNGTEYQMVTDLMFWSQDYSVDKFLNQINQRYAYNAILNLSGKENFQIKRSENLENGSVRVLLERFKLF
jgi:hypothetical protein